MVVNNNPSKNMNKITPRTTISPRVKIDFLLGLSAELDSLLERYAKNPGYKGRTQTAVRGVSKPNTKDVKKSSTI